jgi:hypothetical protein
MNRHFARETLNPPILIPHVKNESKETMSIAARKIFVRAGD